MTVFETVASIRARYGPLVDPAEAVAMLNYVAWHHGPHVALYQAPAGGNGHQHPRGFVRLDILADTRTGRVVDVFVDGPDALEGKKGRATPAWQEKGEIESWRLVWPVDPSLFGVPVDPTRPDLPSPPAPTPEPGEPGEVGDVAEQLLEAMGQLVDAVGGLVTVLAEFNAHIKHVREEGVRLQL